MVTKEQILEESKKLNLVLTDEQIQDLITKNKLPDEEYRLELKKIEIQEKVKDPVKAFEMVQELYSESKKRQTKLKEVQAELDALKAKQVKEAEDKLKADGKLQELLDQRERELAELKPFKDKYDGLSQKVRQTTLNRIKPEYKSYAEKLSDDLLVEFAEMHSLDTPPNTHGGTPPQNGKVRDLTIEEQRQAQLLGLQPADYLEVMESRKSKN